MAEQPGELRRINWSELFPFTRIFQSFRLAIGPSKLALLLLALLLMGIWGGLLDAIWPDSRKPLRQEVAAFSRVTDLGDWRKQADEADSAALMAAYIESGEKIPDNLRERFVKDRDAVVSDALEMIERRYEAALNAIWSNKDIKDEDRPEAIAQLSREYNERYRRVQALSPYGVFAAWLRYDTEMVGQMLRAATQLNFMGGLDDVLRARGPAATGLGATFDPERVGVVGSLVLILRGKQWLITQHPIFAVLLGLGWLAILAIFGGAVARMAAMTFARDERISPRAALAFAGRRFLGFFTAPLLPIGMILAIGVLLAIGGLVSTVPYIGELLSGLSLPLGLVGGFVIALILIGFLGGGSLMYPAIAVEGSDSFDAMSRSYSYVYARPWRTIFYYLVALVYGSFCYIFLRFFVLLMFKATRGFMDLGARATERPGTGFPEATKIHAMWGFPTYDHLLGRVEPFGTYRWEWAASYLHYLWLLLAVLLLCAFLVSFYFCASTIIYFLLRREVDATDIEDVYTGDDDEELPGAPPAGPSSPTAPPSSEPVSPPPAPQPPIGSGPDNTAFA